MEILIIVFIVIMLIIMPEVILSIFMFFVSIPLFLIALILKAGIETKEYLNHLIK